MEADMAKYTFLEINVIQSTSHLCLKQQSHATALDLSSGLVTLFLGLKSQCLHKNVSFLITVLSYKS